MGEVLELFDSVENYDSTLGVNEEEEARYQAQLKAEAETFKKVDEIFIEGNPGEVLPTGHKPYVEPKKLKIQPKPEIKIEPETKVKKEVENKNEMNYTLIKTIKVFKVSFLCVFCQRNFEGLHKVQCEEDVKIFKDQKNWTDGKFNGVCIYCKHKAFGP